MSHTESAHVATEAEGEMFPTSISRSKDRPMPTVDTPEEPATAEEDEQE